MSPLLGAAINFDGEKVNGVDISRPAFKWQVEIKMPDTAMTDQFIEKLYDATGKVNSQLFRFFLAGEALFLGASGSIEQRFQEDVVDQWTITLNYAGQKSRTDIEFGDFKIDLKRGWDYLWVQYQEIEEPTQQTVVQKAIAAYVVQVYEEIDFLEVFGLAGI